MNMLPDRLANQREKEEFLDQEEATPTTTDLPSPGDAHSSTVDRLSTSKRGRQDFETEHEESCTPRETEIASGSVDAHTDGDSIDTPTTQAKKPKRDSSEVWNHFTRICVPNDKSTRCTCNYCGKEYSCLPGAGTSAKWLHLRRQCKKSPLYTPLYKADESQLTLQFERKSTDDGKATNVKDRVFDDKKCRRFLTRMIILDELPFQFVEKSGFRMFCEKVIPQFQVPSRITAARDCYALYLEEKAKLKKLLTKPLQKISLTTDTWTSIQNLSYMCLTAHFIDEDWNYQKKIINFCQVPNHKGETIGKTIEECLFEWKIENVFSLTVDNASSNDLAIAFLKKKIKSWKRDILDGNYIHFRCCAHILNLIVSDGLKDLHESISSIRNAVRYVRSSPSRLMKFKACAEREKLPITGLVSLDVPTRWNSTYLMLESAVKFQKAFERLEEEDGHYLAYFWDDAKRVGPPRKEDWDNACVFMKFLGVFYETTLRLSGSTFVTSNTFFHELALLQSELYGLYNMEDSLLQNMILNMRAKFEKYWGKPENVNQLLFVAAVLDPRYKMEFLAWNFENMYGVDQAATLTAKVKDVLIALFEEYKMKYGTEDGQISGQETLVSEEVASKPSSLSLRVNMFRQAMKKKDGMELKNEVEKYLAEKVMLEDDGFDILRWWKENSGKYKILAMVARDVLTIPISTVASESAFSTGGRVLDPFRSSLTPKMVETLICTQDWMRAYSVEFKDVEFVEQVKKWEKFESDILLSGSTATGEEDLPPSQV